MNDNDDTFPLRRGRLAAFAEALSQAIYDREIEERTNVYHFYDADTVVAMTLGLTYESSFDDRRHSLFRALLATGYLGVVHVLRAHALEFYNVIQYQPAVDDGRSAARYLDVVNALFARFGVSANVAKLRDALRLGQEAAFVAMLQEFGADTFIAFELARGDWKQRLKRFHQSGLLRFHHSSPTVQDLLNQPRVWLFYETISARRSPEIRGTNNLVDAIALGMLHALISDETSTGFQVRFHSDTRAVIHAVQRSRDTANLLSYSSQAGRSKAARWHCENIYRGVDYYVLRASFDVLRFPETKADTLQAPIVSLAELRRVSDELTTGLEDDERDAPFAAEIEIGGRPLLEVIRDLEMLSFVGSVFSRYQPSDLVASFAEFPDVFALAESNEVRAEIRREMEEIRAELAAETFALHEFVSFFREIQNRVVHIQHTPSDFHVDNVDRDLALARWGIELTPRDRTLIRDLLDALLGGRTDTELARACNDVLRLANTGHDENYCAAACVLLWTLGLFDRVVTVINRFHDDHLELPIPLHLMRTAARLRTSPPFGRVEVENHVLALRHLIDRQPASKRGRYLLGLAHVVQMLAGITGDRHLSERSFHLGREALSLLDENDKLGQAFAINHCVNVSAAAGLERRNDYIVRLIQLRSTSAWHYRFADTLAMVYYKDARRLFESSITVESRNAACELLRIATELLQGPWPRYADPEVAQHEMEIQHLQVQIACSTGL